jgi:hypothetical protein
MVSNINVGEPNGWVMVEKDGKYGEGLSRIWGVEHQR